MVLWPISCLRLVGQLTKQEKLLLNHIQTIKRETVHMSVISCLQHYCKFAGHFTVSYFEPLALPEGSM